MSKSKSMSLLRVLWFIRDARSTKGAQRELLNALALRCSPERNFLCWPSYEQLSKDTRLEIITLKRAARALEDSGYISRSVRPHQSNKFFINMAKIVAEATANRLADAESVAARKAAESEESPFATPSPEDSPETDDETEETDDSYVASVFGGTK